MHDIQMLAAFGAFLIPDLVVSGWVILRFWVYYQVGWPRHSDVTS